MNVYSQNRIDSIKNPWERLLCAILVQALIDIHKEKYKTDAVNFFYGEFIEELGVDGPVFLRQATMYIDRRGNKRRGYYNSSA